MASKWCNRMKKSKQIICYEIFIVLIIFRLRSHSELFVSKFGDERMKKFSLTQKLSDDIEDKLYAFEYFRGHLQRKFVIPFDDLPPNTANTIPYLHTWFQTDDAILMLLSNSTIQVRIPVIFYCF